MSDIAEWPLERLWIRRNALTHWLQGLTYFRDVPGDLTIPEMLAEREQIDGELKRRGKWKPEGGTWGS